MDLKPELHIHKWQNETGRKRKFLKRVIYQCQIIKCKTQQTDYFIIRGGKYTVGTLFRKGRYFIWVYQKMKERETKGE